MSVYLYSFNVYLKYTLIKLLFICWLLVHLFYKSLKLLVEFVSLYCKRKDFFHISNFKQFQIHNVQLISIKRNVNYNFVYSS